MKANRIDVHGARKRAILTALALILLTGIVVGICITYSKLHDLWIEQCEITDVAKQVQITTGQNIKPGVILESFGLRKGANLALIDFRKKREEILARIPNIRELKVERHLPDLVMLTVEEREPVARLRDRASKTNGGKVVDAEGVVFQRLKGTNLLPIIYENPKSPIAPGQRLTGRAKAALSLLEFAHTAPYLDVPILEADIAPIDFIKLTLGNYDIAKIAWESMDDPTSATQPSMEKQFKQLHDAVASAIATTTSATPRPIVWNAVIPGNMVYGNTKEPIQ